MQFSEVKYGYWEDVWKMPHVSAYATCSVCKDRRQRGWKYDENHIQQINEAFCPNCGTKMVANSKDIIDEIKFCANEEMATYILGGVFMRLNNWSVVCSGSFGPPELQSYHLRGEVYGHPRFDDGRVVVTSSIEKVVDKIDHKEVVTRSGSVYCLYKENVDPAYESSYPKSYERLTLIELD